MKLRDVHPDIARYLAQDCYCPGEVYDPDGFFFTVYSPNDECEPIRLSSERSAVIVLTACGKELKLPKALIFWHDEKPFDRIVDAQQVDATENNVGIIALVVDGADPDGRTIDEFAPGATAEAMGKVLSIADCVMVG